MPWLDDATWKRFKPGNMLGGVFTDSVGSEVVGFRLLRSKTGNVHKHAPLERATPKGAQDGSEGRRSQELVHKSH